jgi:hypothetical protein
VDALGIAYPDLNDSIDFVMYWWWRAASMVADPDSPTIRAGLITTNSIVQGFNANVVRAAVEQGTRIVWAAPDHPWADAPGDAAVRVAMTVLERHSATHADAVRLDVGDDGAVVRERRAAKLNADLSVTADVDSASATLCGPTAASLCEVYSRRAKDSSFPARKGND